MTTQHEPYCTSWIKSDPIQRSALLAPNIVLKFCNINEMCLMSYTNINGLQYDTLYLNSAKTS